MLSAEKTIGGESSKLEEAKMESMEASSMVLKPCVATKERDSSEFKEAAEPMDDVSSVVVNSYLTKRKAEFDLEEEEQSVGENEEGSDEESKMDEPEAKFDIYVNDVDSFEGLEYYSSSDLELSSDEQPYSDMEKANKHYHIYKRQIIESKGFYAEREFSLGYNYKRIFPMSLEKEALHGKTFRGNCHGGPRAKSYITFMAREKPDGPLVEYQAKSMLTLDGKIHPILCRPSSICQSLKTNAI
ncbi:Cystatin-related plant [Arabidopsis thaliana x Arabidopsis arenosa]|uniref:Cystatin-related plant n=1 Tax=Arabidopsis thaliana x Arabidopsis arenosa TaxID=1240361 RepID=A0A8T1Z2K1_9BRAS|nr:Cystatin-related plant [Arabidopsis thaliana x Arabidopsis arenosa]